MAGTLYRFDNNIKNTSNHLQTLDELQESVEVTQQEVSFRVTQQMKEKGNDDDFQDFNINDSELSNKYRPNALSKTPQLNGRVYVKEALKKLIKDPIQVVEVAAPNTQRSMVVEDGQNQDVQVAADTSRTEMVNQFHEKE